MDRTYNSPLTPLTLLARSAAAFPDKTAVVHGTRRYSYRDFEDRVHRLASALRAAGLQPGETVSFLSPNTPEMLEAHFAVPLAGGVLGAINFRLGPQEIAYILNHSESRFLFVDREFAGLIAPIAGSLETVQRVVAIDDDGPLGALEGVPGPDIKLMAYEDFLAGATEARVELPLDDDDKTYSLNYTSGTTGKPKGVMYTHKGAHIHALGEIMEMGLNPYSTYLWTLPMFHCNGWGFPWAVTAAGGTHVCLRKVEPSTVLELIEREKVTHLCGAPTVLIMLASDPATRDRKFPHPLRIVTAGAPPSPRIIQTMEEKGATIIHVYGLTETYGPHTICAWNPGWDALDFAERVRLKARQGISYSVFGETRVVDADMLDVPRDGTTLGQVVMRGNNIMKGYFKDPEATAEAFRGGWFHSGDLAVMHPDGYIELKDRKKDIIISGGENISSIEVENALYQHPAVLEVAVVAAPDEKWGEVPVAFVDCKPGLAPTEGDLIGFCRERIARFKCPKRVVFGPLPKTATGKVRKFELRAAVRSDTGTPM
ncbi:long-chain-fatty-acid--CoA ligase [Rhodospirillaceae bacterium SYSU D60014]|uniref:long-chain-fatty-acid--CoA ligase n=1 Tax=Virgifigura deserti TaxID=2268457 RepID=UPI000E675968